MTDVDVKTDNDNDNDNEETLQQQRPHTRHGHKSSVDLALELERELDELENTASDPVSLDTQVLSSLVTQLRQSVSELTQTRDDLISSLTQTKTESADRENNLSLADEREKDLKKKIDDLEEEKRADRATINLLRQNVEESRRGLMRLQSEHRRSNSVVQPLALDLSKPGSTAKGSGRSLALTGGNGPFSARLSAVGKGHRRFASIAGSSAQEINYSPSEEAPKGLKSEQSSPRPIHPSLPQETELSTEVPPHTAPLPNQVPAPNKSNDGLLELSVQLLAAQREIEKLKERLLEAEEAKEASDVCVKALQEFIEHHRIGEDEPEPVQPIRPVIETKNSGGWSSIRLWGNAKSSDEVSVKAPSLTSRRSSSSSSPNRNPLSFIPTSPSQTKGLFGLNFLTPVRPSNGQQDTLCNGSDTSSESRRSMSPSSRPMILSDSANTLEGRT